MCIKTNSKVFETIKYYGILIEKVSLHKWFHVLRHVYNKNSFYNILVLKKQIKKICLLPLKFILAEVLKKFSHI